MQSLLGDIFSKFYSTYGFEGVFGTFNPNSPVFYYYQRFLNLFMNRFKYDGLPEETKKITLRNNRLEMWLFFAPAVAWFKDETLGLQVLPVSSNNATKMGIDGLPKEWFVRAGNGYERHLNEKNSVLMFNDEAFSIPFVHIGYELSFLATIDITHKQHLKALRQPLLMEIEEDEKGSAEKFIKELDAYKDVIKIRKRSGRNVRDKVAPYNMQVFNSGATIMTDELNKDFTTFENRILTYLGINNVTFEKKERMLTGELSSNDQIVQSNFTNALECRREAVERVNEMFGTSISVEPKDLEAPMTEQVNTQAQNYRRDGNEQSNVPVQ